MIPRHPFEILSSFKPKRGALHLGNFASLDGAPAMHDIVAVRADAMNKAFSIGAYKAPFEKTPITTLPTVMVFSKLFRDIVPKAWQVAYDAADHVDFKDFWIGNGRVDQSLARAVTRWNEARRRIMERVWRDLGLSWAQAEGISLDNVPSSVSQVQLYKALLTPEEAALFWDESARLAIQLKVLLDKPFPSRWATLYDSITVDVRWAIDAIASVFEKTAAYSVELLARVVAGIFTGVLKGAGKGFWDGLGPVLSVVAVGGLGFWAWRRFGNRRRTA